MKRAFPKLIDLARNSAVSPDPSYALTREMRDAQFELRGAASGLSLPEGTVFPFFERRDMTATGTTSVTGDQGGVTVGQVVPDIGAALRAQLVLEKLGARVWGGLNANARFVAPNTLISAAWKSETAAAGDGTFTTVGLDLSPKRVTAYIDVSWQLLLQGEAIEAYLRTELMGALATECQRVAIAGTGTSNEPRGILNTSGIGDYAGGTNGAAPTYDGVTQLEYLVGQANDRGNTGWLVSPLVRRKLRRTAAFASGSLPIWEQGEARALLGHPAGVVTSVPDTLTKGTSSGNCSAIIHGEFSELFMGFWGPGIIVDAVRTGGHVTGKTRFVATAYFDSGVRLASAFAAQKDALC